MLAAASIAMLSACGSSGNSRPQSAPDPVVVTRVEIQRVCPGELTAPLPGRPQPPVDAVVEGNPAGMSWVGALLAYLGLVEDRLADAAGQCPEKPESDR